MFKRLIEDVPRKINIKNICFVIIWILFEATLTSAMSNLVAVATSANELLKATIVFFVYIFCWEFLEYISDYYGQLSNVYIENNAYSNAFNKLYTTKPEVLKNTNTGYIAGLLNGLVERKKNAYADLIVSFSIGAGYTIYVIFYLLKFSWKYSLIVFLISAFSIVIRLIGTKINKSRVNAVREAGATRTKVFMDNITNISTVQKLRSKKFSDQKFEEANNKCFTTVKRWMLVEEFFFVMYKFLMYSVAPVCFFVYLLSPDPSINKVEFFAYVAMIEIQLVHSTKGIARFVRSYTVYVQQQRKIDDIVKYQNFNYTQSSIGNNFTTIEIKDVVYKYKRSESENSVTVKIPYFGFNKGDFVCISGESGQGKTTTLNILSGCLETTNVLIDGSPTFKNIDAVYIAQDVEMFDMSLRDNLTLGMDVSDTELIYLIKQVGLEEWYLRQPKGLDTILGERGVFVSTGQRQRLNLLRGLLIKNKEIYLLDEPTSNVDSITEEKMIDLIQERLKGKTVIIVTHRKAIKKICNKHYIFENGVCKIAE